LADRYGRRPILLWGVIASAAMIVLFGWNYPYWITLTCRLFGGILNGNIGITRAYLGEITDKTNQAAGFSLLVITFSIGSTIGPIVGGYLSKPAEKFDAMNTPFWRDHPFLLPVYNHIISVIRTIDIDLIL
jgi:MFS family permease